jgi:hypothetical protein
MSLLDFFRRKGASEPRAAESTSGGAESPAEDRGHGVGVPPGSTAEGPPVGVSDPGSLSGEDAGEVVASEEDVELDAGDGTRPTGG